MLVTNCAETTLAPYRPSEENPWDAARVQHLMRRIGFGATLNEILYAVERPPQTFVQQILDGSAAREPRPAPEWAYYDYDEITALGITPFEGFMEINYAHQEDALRYGVRETFVNFWHDHFAIQYETHSCASFHYQYWKVLTDHAFGNFKQFVKDITVTPAMLFFLNGFDNRKGSPNENYARELFELFTLGENNGYTQEDIVEASRALTGFNGWTSYCGKVRWTPWSFDDGQKTIFGRTGNFTYATLIDMLFEERPTEISEFICGKVYRYFVNPVVNDDIVAGLARTFRESDWELMPVFRQLFASEHFFDPANVGVLIKDPMDHNISFLRQGNFPTFENFDGWNYWSAVSMGMQVGQPPDVSGWTANRSWIDSNRLTLRWNLIHHWSWMVHDHNQTTLPNWVRSIVDANSPIETVSRAIVDYFIPRGLLTEEAYETATDAMKGELPENYYTNGDWNLYWDSVSWQVALIFRHICRLPEFQFK